MEEARGARQRGGYGDTGVAWKLLPPGLPSESFPLWLRPNVALEGADCHLLSIVRPSAHTEKERGALRMGTVSDASSSLVQCKHRRRCKSGPFQLEPDTPYALSIPDGHAGLWLDALDFVSQGCSFL